jgi:hypothetical protein
MRHRLAAEAGELEIGWFLLGTMRQERDFQYMFEYMGWNQRPFDDPAFILPELTDLISHFERLPVEERQRHLSLLNATDVQELRSRLVPKLTLTEDEGAWAVLVQHTSLDGRSHMMLELRDDSGASTAVLSDDLVSVQARSGERIELDVTVSTDAEPLTPLGREKLFNSAFEDYYARQRRAADSLTETLGAARAAGDPRVLAFRRMERQVSGLELLASEEKLIASMPNYATYFGRDQMMSALMLEPISSVDLQELVIASVLRKVDAGRGRKIGRRTPKPRPGTSPGRASCSETCRLRGRTTGWSTTTSSLRFSSTATCRARTCHRRERAVSWPGRRGPDGRVLMRSSGVWPLWRSSPAPTPKSRPPATW